MSQDTKLELSPFQLEALYNTHFFDTKREITAVILALFNRLQLELNTVWSRQIHLKEEYHSPAAKIFKGENYSGYPYMNLDFPRLFNGSNVFAFRSMLWWGNHISFTLHLQGKAFEQEAGRLFAALPSFEHRSYFICHHTSPWEYHFGQDNFIPVEEVLVNDTLFQTVKDNGFLKISRKLELKDYNLLVETGKKTFEELMKCLA